MMKLINQCINHPNDKIWALTLLLSFAVLSSAIAETQNMLVNASFEQGIAGGKGFPSGWKKGGWKLNEEDTQFGVTSGKEGKGYAVFITNKVAAHSYLSQDVVLKKKGNYKFSAWVKTQGIDVKEKGANIGVISRLEYAGDLRGDTDWQRSELYIRSDVDDKAITVILSLGHYGSLNSGKVFFDEVSLEKVETIPGGAKVVAYTVAEAAREKEEKAKAAAPYYQPPPQGIIMLIILTALGLLIIASLLIYRFEVARKNKQ